MIINTAFNERALDPGMALVKIARSHASSLLPQLVGNDRVHKFGAESVDALLQYRIGDSGHAKTAFALTTADQAKVLAAIYVHQTDKPIARPADLPGDVNAILNQPAVTPFTADPTALVFYTISSMKGGAGPLLISALLNYDGLPKNAWYATLSPLRTLAGSYNIKASDMNDNQRSLLAWMHLRDIVNPVQEFHMKNGAIIGDIKTNCNADGTLDDTQGHKVMVNYLYSPDPAARAANRALFSDILSGAQPRDRLMDLVHPDLKARMDALTQQMNGMVAVFVSRALPRQPITVP